MTISDISPRPALDRYLSTIFENQRTWVRRIGAVSAGGHARPVFDTGGVLAACTGTTGAIMLPHSSVGAIATLPEAFDWLRSSGSNEVLIWSAKPQRHMDRWLSAHGAHESFAPRWMIRPAHQPIESDLPRGVTSTRQASPDDLPLLLETPDLPYFSQWQARATLRLATDPTTRDAVALVLALANDRVVGRAVMSICDDPMGRIAGIYDVGVSPRWQRRGVGRQMMHAMIETARERAADLITLNSTPAGEPLYRSLGFEHAGDGQTWLLPAATLRTPPGDDLTRLAMLISGGGDIGSLASLANQHLPNGDTPLAHAARFDQPEVAKQLLALGTISDLAALWQLGFREDALVLMCDQDALDARRGQQGSTPLHTAIYWDDLEFLEALLDAGADPHVRDRVFDSDAWGWCHALGRAEALRLLNERAHT